MYWNNIFLYNIAPGGLGVQDWDFEGYHLSELLLYNQEARDENIASMHIQLERLAAVDDEGKEHNIVNFNRQVHVNLPGVSTGKHLRTNGIVNLEPGVYTKLRMYVKPGSYRQIHTYREEQRKPGKSMIQFDIDKPLIVYPGKNPVLQLRFDFPDFERRGLIKWIANGAKQLKNVVVGGRNLKKQLGFNSADWFKQY